MEMANGKKLKFRCDGMTGPPCTVKRGDIVNLKIDFVPGNVFVDSLFDVFKIGVNEQFNLDSSNVFVDLLFDSCVDSFFDV